MSPMPRKKGRETVSWSIRVPPEELERWKRAAELELCDASDLVRRAAKREADRILRSQPPAPKTRR